MGAEPANPVKWGMESTAGRKAKGVQEGSTTAVVNEPVGGTVLPFMGIGEPLQGSFDGVHKRKHLG